MGLALYRKYRPKRLSEVVGQEHITTSLQNALKSGAISHAYLFTGPRGVGKTSIARILAHEINGLPYTKDSSHLDIIEIDAASNRRIDEIRDLRDKVHIAPSSAKYKVYIIDEVHMLTREAFNALLKTLEEPPEHAVFILATTESHKVPDTVISRTQRYIFKPITQHAAVQHLQDLAKREKINITSDALEILASHGTGSFRDSINLLDQLSGGTEPITKEVVEQMLGVPNEEIINSLLKALESKDASTLGKLLEDAQTAGLHAGKVAKQLAQQLRERFLQSPSMQYKETAQLLKELARIAGSTDSFADLELSLFEFVVQGQPTISTARIVATEPKLKKTAEPQAEEQTTVQIISEPENDNVPLVKSTPENFWNDYLHAMKRKRSTLYSVLRMAQPNLQADTLVLEFSFAFHQKQISQAANLQMLANIASELLGKNIQIQAVLQKELPASVPSKTTATHAKSSHSKPEATAIDQKSPLSDVSSIFNGAELVE